MGALYSLLSTRDVGAGTRDQGGFTMHFPSGPRFILSEEKTRKTSYSVVGPDNGSGLYCITFK